MSITCSEDYLERHNSVAKGVLEALARKYELIDTEMLLYKCKPEQVLSNNRAKLLWDTPFITDRAVEANLVLFDKQAKTATIIDKAVPYGTNIEATIAGKKRKYLQLSVEFKDMFQLRSVTIIPLFLYTYDLVTRAWSKSIEILGLHERHSRVMQKAAMLGKSNIVRKVLSLA
jgi:hypothetical protein